MIATQPELSSFWSLLKESWLVASCYLYLILFLYRTLPRCISRCQTIVYQSCHVHQKDPGPCIGRFTRYYYNTETGRCEEFVYGGCHGNENRFE